MNWRINNKMEFEEILKDIKNGDKAVNMNWNGKKQWIRIQKPDKNSMISEIYIVMENNKGLCIPWLASQQDLFSDQWCIVLEK